MTLLSDNRGEVGQSLNVSQLAIIVPTHYSTGGVNTKTKAVMLIDAPIDKSCSVKIIISARLI